MSNGTFGAFVQLAFAAANESEFGPTQFGNTGEDGCAIFSGLTPGYTYEARPVNYFLAVNNPHLVTDTFETGTNKFFEYPVAQTVTIPTNGTTAQLSFIFAPPGSIVTTFTGNGTSGVPGDSIVFENSSEPVPNPIEFPATPVVSTSATSLASPPAAMSVTAGRMFPFSVASKPAVGSPYTVYAGVCSKDNPVALSSSNTNSTVSLTPGLNTSTTVQVPPVAVKVYSGTSGTVAQSAPAGTLTRVAIEDTGCGYWRGYSSAAGTASIPPGGISGLLTTPYLPFAKYLACVSENVNTANAATGGTYYYKSVEFENVSTSGVTAGVNWGSATTTPATPCPS